MTKAQKAQTFKNMLRTFFYEKLKQKNSKHFQKTQTTDLARRVSASAGPWRAKKGDHLGVFNILPVAKYQKGDHLETLKTF